MRPFTMYGSVLILCLIVSFTTADKKWKYNDENPYQKVRSQAATSPNPEKIHQQPKDPGNKNRKILSTDASEEEPQERKKILARIEHGKVKVLRRKETQEEEDPRAKVCKKSCSSEESDSSSEEVQPKGKKQKKIKYSIKFQHEKQKKKDDNDNMRIMRLHKNGRKEYGKDDDDDSSEEDEKPIKRFHYMEDDE